MNPRSQSIARASAPDSEVADGCGAVDPTVAGTGSEPVGGGGWLGGRHCGGADGKDAPGLVRGGEVPEKGTGGRGLPGLVRTPCRAADGSDGGGAPGLVRTGGKDEGLGGQGGADGRAGSTVLEPWVWSGRVGPPGGACVIGWALPMHLP